MYLTNTLRTWEERIHIILSNKGTPETQLVILLDTNASLIIKVNNQGITFKT